MTWTISASGPKAEAITKLGEAKFIGLADSAEAKAFEGARAIGLALALAAPDTGNVSFSASGSSTYCSVSCSCG